MRGAEFRAFPSSHAVCTSTPKDQWNEVVKWIEDQGAQTGRNNFNGAPVLRWRMPGSRVKETKCQTGTILSSGLQIPSGHLMGQVPHRTQFGAGKPVKTSTRQGLADGMDGPKTTRGGAPKGACRAGTPTQKRLRFGLCGWITGGRLSRENGFGAQSGVTSLGQTLGG